MMLDRLIDLCADWEDEVAEFATKDDPYYNGVRQCIADLRAVVGEAVETAMHTYNDSKDGL